jgi:hypothetical protein
MPETFEMQTLLAINRDLADTLKEVHFVGGEESEETDEAKETLAAFSASQSNLCT